MRGICSELLRHITEAINFGMSDEAINARIEYAANCGSITAKEYSEIYDEAMHTYKLKLGGRCVW